MNALTPTRFQVFDTHTGRLVFTRGNRVAADRLALRLDACYRSMRYYVRPLQAAHN